jgi:type II secretory ATPase GspE/PulE/Tfp pilus assembly ATPase PilB-like protein
MTVRRFSRVEDAGRVRRVLSDSFDLPTKMRGLIAVVETEQGKRALVWTGRTEHSSLKVAVAKMCAQRSVEIDEEWHTDVGVIQLLVSEANRAVSASYEQVDSEALRMADDLLSDALRWGSSDLHITVRDGRGVVQARQFGEIRTIKQMPGDVCQRICVALFNSAGDTGGSAQFSDRDYQDAVIERSLSLPTGKNTRLRIRYAGSPIYPSGFKVVLRLLRLDAEGLVASFDQLGFDADQIKVWEEALARPSGLILLCGTTGSGKSTSLQTALVHAYEAAEGRISVLTIENPPEYRIPGADQIPVLDAKDSHESGKSGFAGALRQALRMDPDLIMVGEVRDTATAIATQQAVQTGHLALTTTHASHPVAALDRLIQLGMERQVVGSEEFVALVVHQMLLPLLCPECSLGIEEWRYNGTPDDVIERVMREVNRVGVDLSKVRFRRKGGCSACGHQGIKGRTVVAEMLVPDFTLNQHVTAGEMNLARAYWRGTAKLRPKVSRCIGRTIREQAMEHVRRGRVSLVDVDFYVGIGVEESAEEAAHRYLTEVRRQGRALDVSSGSGGGTS